MMFSRKKLVVRLAGGLGNQMFQYAAARAIARRSNAELVLDTWSGFVRDFSFGRQYELNAFPIAAREATRLERAPFWVDLLTAKITGPQHQSICRSWTGDSLLESRFAFLPEISTYKIARPTRITGYWQTARYFEGHEAIVLSELRPPPSSPSEFRFHELAAQMRRENSVAVGVRLYEECTEAEIAASGGLKSVLDVSTAALKLASSRANPHFYIFCTHRSEALKKLKLPGTVTFVTHDDGFLGTVPRLWLLTQCRHHILTNSSFYWWGAWLSREYYSETESTIFSADNFVNQDSAAHAWRKF